MSDTTNPAATGELRSVARSQIRVEDGFNPRTELGELEELAASVAEHGILQPLLVRPGEDGSLVLVDGHRRLAAAAQVGLEELPVLVRADLGGQALVAALVTALKRRDLDPVEEAKAYGRLIDGGLTKKGAAEAVGVAQKTITVRLQILAVHERLHPAIAAGEIALSSVAALVAMAKVSPELAEQVGKASPDRIDAWAAERVVSDQQGKHGLWPASHIDVERLDLDAEQRQQVEALSDEWSAWRPRFGEDDLDRARAAGVLYAQDDDGYGHRSGVICDTELVHELTIAALERDVEQRHRRLAQDREAQGKPEPGSPEAKQLKAERKVERELECELATFRHTCASLLFEAGKNVKQVQEWLGHADPGFTLRTTCTSWTRGSAVPTSSTPRLVLRETRWSPSRRPQPGSRGHHRDPKARGARGVGVRTRRYGFATVALHVARWRSAGPTLLALSRRSSGTRPQRARKTRRAAYAPAHRGAGALSCRAHRTTSGGVADGSPLSATAARPRT